MHNTRSFEIFLFMLSDSALFSFMYYIVHNVMYVFVYATHRKTELV